jgi:hypothetical protein
MVIRSKYSGTCRDCGNRFPAGTIVEWERGQGASCCNGTQAPSPGTQEPQVDMLPSEAWQGLRKLLISWSKIYEISLSPKAKQAIGILDEHCQEPVAPVPQVEEPAPACDICMITDDIRPATHRCKVCNFDLCDDEAAHEHDHQRIDREALAAPQADPQDMTSEEMLEDWDAALQENFGKEVLEKVQEIRAEESTAPTITTEWNY